MALKNILVATDFSEPSDVAMAYGRDLARTYNARLHVLHVVENIMIRYSSEVGFAVPDFQGDLETAARRDVAALITDDDWLPLSTSLPQSKPARTSLKLLSYTRRRRHRSDRRRAHMAAVRCSIS